MKTHKISGVIGWDATAADLNRFLSESNGDDVELVISSPGGLVGEALDMFNAIRSYQGKTTAILSGYAMSAASYIPMAADHVMAEDNAVMMIHNAQGIEWGDHNQMTKTANILKGLSSMLGQAYSKFTGKGKDEIAAMMDAETWFFGDEIVNAGFAHGGIVREEMDGDADSATAQARLAFSNMVSKLSGEKTAFYNDLSRAATALGATGAKPTKTDEVIKMDLKTLKEKHPDLCAALVSEATAEMDEKVKGAMAEGVKAENERIKGVRAQSVPGHEPLIEAMAFDGKSTAADAALAIVAAEQKVRKVAAESFIKDAPAVVPTVSNDTPDTGEDLNAPVETRAKATWEKSPAIRAEFGSYGAYEAFRKAQAEGRVKILGSKE